MTVETELTTQKATRKRLLTRKQRAFLASFAVRGTVTSAAEDAGVTRRRHYRWLDESEDYKAAFVEACEEAADALEDAARERAIRGVRRLKFDAKGKPMIDPDTNLPYVEYIYSDVLLMFLLKGLRPEKYRESAKIEADVPGLGQVVVLRLPDNGRDVVTTEAIPLQRIGHAGDAAVDTEN